MTSTVCTTLVWPGKGKLGSAGVVEAGRGARLTFRMGFLHRHPPRLPNRDSKGA